MTPLLLVSPCPASRPLPSQLQPNLPARPSDAQCPGHRTCGRADGDALDADAEAAANEVRAAGRLAAIHVCDLGDETAVTGLIPACEAALGPLTLLVNSASLFEDDSLASMSRASWDDHMEVNLRTPIVLAQAFARQLPADRPGLIINLLDQRVLNPTADFFSYSLSKQALWSATKMLAQALAERIAANGPIAVQAIRRSARACLGRPEADAMRIEAVRIQTGVLRGHFRGGHGKLEIAVGTPRVLMVVEELGGVKVHHLDRKSVV